jgi:1,4-alpha-glucan branching enzyme
MPAKKSTAAASKSSSESRTPEARTVSTKAVTATPSKASSKASSSKTNSEKVEFEFFAPEAKEVAVAGSFNEWKPKQTVLARDKSGRWSVALPLTPGRYEYRFVVDGSWVNDQRPTEAVSNPFGSINNVLKVGE